MSLVECRECDGEISRSAKTCPHCGSQAPTRSAALGNVGEGMTTAGCWLTLLVTIPIILVFTCA